MNVLKDIEFVLISPFATALELYNVSLGPIPLFAVVEIACVCISIGLFFVLSPDHPPKFKMVFDAHSSSLSILISIDSQVFVAISFFMSIIWIYLIAGDLVALLEVR
jgi:hypothetical protein